VPKDNSSHPQPPVSTLVFNREVFLKRMMDDEEFAHEVVDEFLKELFTMTNTLAEEVAQADLESIGKQAHKIKGSSANVGGETLKDAALRVEQAAKAGNMAEVLSGLPDVDNQARQLAEALRQWRTEMPLTKAERT
jgi:HPt (histidine-containing phosphotransfer) domain-containing protein